MAIRLLDRVPIDRIEAQAKPVDLGRVCKVAVMAVVYGLAFSTRKVGIGIGVTLGWIGAAAKTGWQDAAMPAEERARARVA